MPRLRGLGSEFPVKLLHPTTDFMRITKTAREARAYGQRYAAAARMLDAPDPPAEAEQALRAFGTEVRDELPSQELLVRADAAMFALPADYLSDLGRGARESIAGHLNGWMGPFGSEERLPYDIALIQTRNRGWSSQQVEHRLVELLGADGMMPQLDGAAAYECAALRVGPLPGSGPRVPDIYALSIEEGARRSQTTRASLGEIRALVRIDDAADATAPIAERAATLVDRLVDGDVKTPTHVEDASELARLVTNLVARAAHPADDARLIVLIDRAATSPILPLLDHFHPLTVALDTARLSATVRRDVDSPDDVRAILGALPATALEDWNAKQRHILGAVLPVVSEQLLPGLVGDHATLQRAAERLLGNDWRDDEDTAVVVKRIFNNLRREGFGDTIRPVGSLRDDLVVALHKIPADQPHVDMRTAALLAESLKRDALPASVRRVAELPGVIDSPLGRSLIIDRMHAGLPPVDADAEVGTAMRELDAALARVVDTPTGRRQAAYAWLSVADDHTLRSSIALADAANGFEAMAEPYAADLAHTTSTDLASLATDMRRASRSARESDMPQLGQVGRARASLRTLQQMRELQASAPASI